MGKPVVLVGIDPGKSGGLAICYGAGNIVCESLDTETLRDLWDQIASIKESVALESNDVFCLVEQVGTGRPGNAAKAMTTFARHCGHIEAFLTAAEIPFDYVLPEKWMDATVGKSRPKVSQGKRKAKNYIKAYAQRRFPHLKITLKTSDALGILAYLMDKQGVV